MRATRLAPQGMRGLLWGLTKYHETLWGLMRGTRLAPQGMRGLLWGLMRTYSKSPSTVKPVWLQRKCVVSCGA